MCRKAIESDDRVKSWLDVDLWECSQKRSSSFPKVVNELAVFLQDLPVHLMYVCGADLLVRCGIFSLGLHSVVAVGRPGYSDEVMKALAMSKNVKKLYFIDKDTDDISSTKIRGEMRL
jgi:nicotinic acid mononucleotide adenylyltransferase